MADHLFVVTGGPGSGKTTLVEALGASGIRHMPEAGRAIIQDQVSIGGQALPWADRVAFAELMLAWELRSYREASVMDGLVLMDRGMPDVIGYLRLCGLPVPDHAQEAARRFRYNRKVLVAPFWPEIFAQDEERKQSPTEAEATCRMMIETYVSCGYEPVLLPLAGVAERVAFMREAIGAS